MKMKIVTAIVGSLAVASINAAETYNIEAGIQHWNTSTDDKTDTTATAIGGTYYFKPIAIDSAQPFMELDVLQKASSVSARYVNMSIETSVLSKTTLNPVQLSGTAYVDNFVLGLNNVSWDKAFNLKSNASLNYGIKSTTTGVGVGYWVLPTTVVSLTNESDKATYTRSATSLNNIADLKKTANSISTHTVTSLGGTQSLVLDFSYKQIKQEQSVTENNKEYAAKVRYYPEGKYFIEGGYIANTGDNESDKGKTYALGAGYALTPRFAVLLLTSKFDGDVSAKKSSESSTTLTAGYRF